MGFGISSLEFGFRNFRVWSSWLKILSLEFLVCSFLFGDWNFGVGLFGLDLVFEVWELEFWCFGIRVWGLGFGIWSLDFGVSKH